LVDKELYRKLDNLRLLAMVSLSFFDLRLLAIVLLSFFDFRLLAIVLLFFFDLRLSHCIIIRRIIIQWLSLKSKKDNNTMAKS
jgi:hypothetical protein